MANNASRIKAQAKYDAAHCKHYSLKYNTTIDKEVVEKLASVPSIQGYIKQLIIADLAKERAKSVRKSAPKSVPKVKAKSKTKFVSLDNGHSLIRAEDVIQYLSVPNCPISWDTLVSFMDDELIEQVNSELAPCSELEFLTRYLELSKEDLIIG